MDKSFIRNNHHEIKCYNSYFFLILLKLRGLDKRGLSEKYNVNFSWWCIWLSLCNQSRRVST